MNKCPTYQTKRSGDSGRFGRRRRVGGGTTARFSAVLLSSLLVFLGRQALPSSDRILSVTPAVFFAAAASGSIPRSTSHRLSLSDPEVGNIDGGSSDSEASSGTAKVRHPPWNRSPRIDLDGFLTDSYKRIPGEWEPEADIGGRHGPSSKSYRALQSGRAPAAVVRQVPGDGNCLFHSVSATLAQASDGDHPALCTTRGLRSLRKSSSELRRRAVDCLSRDPRRRLFLQGRETLRAGELVDAAAAQYGLTGEEYCEQMGRDSYWGGGPEIVALCNVLRRPIHVYELCSVEEEDGDVVASGQEGSNGVCAGDESPELYSEPSHNQGKHKTQHRRRVHPQFRLRRMACFGSPRYDRREPLHILSADSRFPDVSPGRQLPTGNHFLAMFPESPKAGRKKKRRGEREDLTRRPRKVRGGAAEAAAGKERAETKNGRGREAAVHRSRRHKLVVDPKRGDDGDNLFGRIGRWVNRMDRSGGGGSSSRGEHMHSGCGGESPFGGLAASLMERWLDLLGRILAVI